MSFWSKLFGKQKPKQDHVDPIKGSQTIAKTNAPASPVKQPEPESVSTATRTRHYSNREWGFELDYPADWETQWENSPEGSWTIAIGLLGKAVGGGRPGVIVNARRGPVLAGGGGGFSKVYVIGADGSSPQLPKTTQEFIETAKKDLARSFRGFHLLSSDEIKIADGPAAQMVYSYDGGSGRTQEMCMTRFGTFVTFQFICEVPADNFPAVEPVFKSIIDSFRLMS